MKIVRPVLSLIASEMVLAAEQVARHKTGTHKRLPLPFYAILDELRFGVRLPTLPYISNVLRKFGIDYVYACTNGGDEEALYGEADADILQTNATSIYGGFDKRSAPEINDVAGRASVVVASRNDDGGVTQSEEQRDVLTAVGPAETRRRGSGHRPGRHRTVPGLHPLHLRGQETPQTHGPRTGRGDLMTDDPDERDPAPRTVPAGTADRDPPALALGQPRPRRAGLPRGHPRPVRHRLQRAPRAQTGAPDPGVLAAAPLHEPGPAGAVLRLGQLTPHRDRQPSAMRRTSTCTTCRSSATTSPTTSAHRPRPAAKVSTATPVTS